MSPTTAASAADGGATALHARTGTTSDATALDVPPGAGTLPDLGDPAERGRLEIADRVVERIAGYAVTLVPEATAAPRRVLGRNVGQARENAQAHVDARVDGRIATVDATIAVHWPNPVRRVADAVRRRVRAEVLDLTGVTVDHIDLDVVSLPVAQQARRRVL